MALTDVEASPRQGLFLGAGFSYEFGMPLVSGLTNELKGCLAPQKLDILWHSRGAGCSNVTISKVTNLLLNDNLHYEEIIGALEVEENRHENRAIKNELSYIRFKILELVFAILHQRHVQNESFIESAVEMHRGFNSLVPSSHPLWIFSLNHDLIVEMFSAKFNIPLKKGFSDEVISLRVDCCSKTKLKFKTLQRAAPSSNSLNYFGSNESGINLLKIHGSLDIFGYDDLRQDLCMIPEEKSIKAYINMLSALPLLQEPHILNEFFVFDDKNEEQYLRKSILSGVFKFKDQNRQIISLKILDVFKNNLKLVDELIIIGYGFVDLHVNIILKEWLEISSQKR